MKRLAPVTKAVVETIHAAGFAVTASRNSVTAVAHGNVVHGSGDYLPIHASP